MAPERVYDPSVPSPWVALQDNGVKYFWNPETQKTQYEHPAPAMHMQQQPGGMMQGGGPAPAQTNGMGPRSAYGQPSIGGGAGQVNGFTPCSTVEEFRRKNNMEIKGHCPDPFLTFEDANLPTDIMMEIRKAGFQYPTPIQSQAWPIAMQGRDMVGIAKTGSGKTVGFLLPGMLHIRATNKDPRRGPTVLCVAPTRELAMQIKEEADKFGRSGGIRNTCVYGGAPRGPQMRDVRMGVHIVIATPGRLNDFLDAQAISLRQVSYLVMDEADRMLDMGFEPQIQQIVAHVPEQRQTLFFSATWPREVQSIARQFVRNDPVYVFIDHSDDNLVANKNIRQAVDVIDPFSKLDRLRQILKSKPHGTKTLIFCTTKKSCDELARALNREFGAAAIHGDKKQPERDYVLRCFKTGHNSILVATDVAARGLDIPGVAIVINFDFPNGVEDYIHRIGRTGRAGNTGESYTFFTRDDGKYAHELIEVLRNSEQIIPPQLLELSSQCAPQKGSRWYRPTGRGGGRSGGGRFGSSFGSSNRDNGRSWRPQNDRFSGGNRYSRYNQNHRSRSRSKSPIRRKSPDYGEYRRDGHEASPKFGDAVLRLKRTEQPSLLF